MSTTLEDWQKRAAAAGYRFQCPVCKHVATPHDFKALGADPQRAAQECIGRHMPKSESREAFGPDGQVNAPCNFAAYGLFRLGEVVIGTDGKEIGVMPPAPVQEAVTP